MLSDPCWLKEVDGQDWELSMFSRLEEVDQSSWAGGNLLWWATQVVIFIGNAGVGRCINQLGRMWKHN